ncbi:uncharacterized protein ACIQIH_002143 [Cyanocitta cristata]
MSALERVRAGGRGLERRLDSVPAEALLAGLRAAGAVSEPEVAALGAPGGSGWVRRLRALAVARGDRTCRVLLDLLAELEGPPQPGPFDFYNPQRDAAPAHRSDCPCCRPEPGWTRHRQEEEEQGEPKEGDEGPEEEDGGPKDEDGDEGPEDEEGDEGPEDEDGGRDEGPEEEDGGGDEGPEDGDEGPKDEDEDGGPEDEDGGGEEGPEDGDKGPEDEDGDEGPEDEDGGGDEDEGDGEGEEE